MEISRVFRTYVCEDVYRVGPPTKRFVHNKRNVE